MEKDYKTKSVKASYIPSNCSEFESSIKKWYDAETERLVSKGEDINNIFIVADPYYNEGTIICDDYTLDFNRDERVIDLVIKSKEDSPIWNDVIYNVPAQFASCIDNPENFVYGFSTAKSKEKWYFCFKRDDKESGTLFPIVGFSEMLKTLIR